MAVTIYHNPRCSTSRNTLALLEKQGVQPRIVEYLATPLSADEIKDLLKKLGKTVRELVRKTLDHFREAMAYTLAIPARFVRLRLACLWPVLIGMETLRLLVRNDGWLDPARASRLPRRQVYRILAYSLPMVLSNGLLRAWFGRQLRDIEAVIG